MNRIDGFQFENLLQNRIPFTLLNLGAEPGKRFGPIAQMHLNQQVTPVTDSQVFEKLQELGAPKDHAIVIICDQGSEAARVADQLFAKGYGNVFAVDGGWAAMPPAR